MTLKYRINLFDIFVYLFCIVFAFFCFYPMWYVFIVSITRYEDFIKQTFIFLPPLKPVFTYYQVVLAGEQFRNAFFISIAKTSIATVTTIIILSAMSYGISKNKLKGMKILNFYIIFTMFFGGGLIPTYLNLDSLGLIDTFWVMIVPALTPVGYFIIMRNFFAYSVSKELEESALIDGANELRIFFNIILPLSKPMIAAISLFTAVNHWNDWTSYLFYVKDPRFQPFVYILRRMLFDISAAGKGSQDLLIDSDVWVPPLSLRMTVVICAMVPIMVVYPFMQKHFTKGILIGAVKE